MPRVIAGTAHVVSAKAFEVLSPCEHRAVQVNNQRTGTRCHSENLPNGCDANAATPRNLVLVPGRRLIKGANPVFVESGTSDGDPSFQVLQSGVETI